MHPLFSQLQAMTYQTVIKPVLFLVNPEHIHNAALSSGRWMGKVELIKAVTRWLWAYDHPILATTLDGIRFPNPVGLSAGYDYNGDLTGILPAVGYGFQTVGTVTLQPYEGNPRPMLDRFPKSRALLVNKGLKNIGARAVIAKLSGEMFAVPVGISIASTNTHFNAEEDQIQDILRCFRLFEASKVAHSFYELNISCPNTFGGEPFTTPDKLKRLMTAMDSLKLRKPLYVKMPIDLTHPKTLELLHILSKHRVQGVIFGNLTKDKQNPAVDPADAAVWKTRKGNLSGKPTWERSNALIALTKKHFKDRFTILGTGGIFSPEDAAQKLAAGADAVQLITGMIFQGPQLIGQINYHLAQLRLSHSRTVRA